ncbi:5'-deoxyadenosine deaminase, partial [Tanacetum coccineum]
MVHRIGLGINHCWSIEDTNLVTFEKIEEQFGATVRHIVERETKVSNLGKLKYKNESPGDNSHPAQSVLKMATVNGAKAVLWDNEIGSLKVGKKANLIVINPSSCSMVPIHDCILSLVYCLRNENIESVNSSDVLGNFATTDGRKSFSKPIGSEIFQFGVLFAFHKDRAAKKKTAVAFAEVSLESRQNLIYVDL